ncbi:MAG: hypothetical protein C4518_07250 [Desulfobacteraceae bacterium]|nr:MAG: hypothetical protein C4518_07250 [Desulfobacteraceae bacterium]
MKRIKAIAGILAIFTLGIMTGALGTGLVVKHRVAMFHERGPARISPMFMERIGDRLDLTSDQRTEVKQILDLLEDQLKEIRQVFDPKIKAAFDDAFNRIATHLTDPQKQQLEIFRKQFPKHCRKDKGFLHSKHRDHPEGTPPMCQELSDRQPD